MRTEPHICACGYSTMLSSHMKRHRNLCRVVCKNIDERDIRIEMLSEQNKQMAEQLAAKDRQIEQLIKRPRTVNNRFVLNNRVNCFGRETLDHIPDAKYQELLRDPCGAGADMGVEHVPAGG